MTPSSITLGGRGGRLSHAASVKSEAVGGRVALPLFLQQGTNENSSDI